MIIYESIYESLVEDDASVWKRNLSVTWRKKTRYACVLEPEFAALWLQPDRKIPGGKWSMRGGSGMWLRAQQRSCTAAARRPKCQLPPPFRRLESEALCRNFHTKFRVNGSLFGGDAGGALEMLRGQPLLNFLVVHQDQNHFLKTDLNGCCYRAPADCLPKSCCVFQVRWTMSCPVKREMIKTTQLPKCQFGLPSCVAHRAEQTTVGPGCSSALSLSFSSQLFCNSEKVVVMSSLKCTVPPACVSWV